VDVSKKAMEALVVSAMRENLADKIDVEFYSSCEIPLHFSSIPDLVGKISAHKNDIEKLRGSVSALKNVVDPTYEILETHVKLLIAADKMIDPVLASAKEELLTMKKELSDFEKKLSDLKKDPVNNAEHISAAESKIVDLKEDVKEGSIHSFRKFHSKSKVSKLDLSISNFMKSYHLLSFFKFMHLSFKKIYSFVFIFVSLQLIFRYICF
jgi:hypothetical protein